MKSGKAENRSTDGMIDYDANSRAQQNNALGNAEVISELAQRVSSHADVLNMTDFGCGPGQSAIETIKPALSCWNDCAPNKMVSVCHADQPGNDWNALMQRIFGDNGYVRGANPAQVSTSVGSFYERMRPDRSVSLATCFFASHWLRSPASLPAPDTVWFADLTGEARTRMWQTAERDWIRFLRLRAEELRPDGYLFVSTIGAAPDKGEVNGTAASGRTLYRAMQDVTSSMTEDGLLDRKTSEAFLFGLWFMTAEEARSPFEIHADLNEAYEIDTIEVVPDQNGDIFADCIDEPDLYAQNYAGYTRAFAASSLRHQLFRPSETTKRTAEALETEFFKRYEALYKEKTSALALEQWHLNVILRRR